ncbi:MAG: hypothetical protein FWG10_13515 [Eubacteriaceae bacterium]|nr:hypothetical protein [Eubacteriaceae bacterium]
MQPSAKKAHILKALFCVLKPQSYTLGINIQYSVRFKGTIEPSQIAFIPGLPSLGTPEMPTSLATGKGYADLIMKPKRVDPPAG